MPAPAVIIAAALFFQPSAPQPQSPAPASPQARAKPAALSGAEVLRKMAEVYHGCSSYQDEGEVSILFDTATGKWTDRRPFKTAFVRPDKFRFEFTSKPGPMAKGQSARYVVWADGKKIRSWWTLQSQVQELKDMDMALAAPTGVSGGSAGAIPSLLLSTHWGRGIDRLDHPAVVDQEKVGEASCYKLQGKDAAGTPMTLWIDANTFMVLKMFEKQNLGGGTAETTTTYKPQLNPKIPDERFQFTPPKG